MGELKRVQERAPQDAYRGVNILRRDRNDTVEFFCTVGNERAAREFVASSPGSIHAMIDVELARQQEARARGEKSK